MTARSRLNVNGYAKTAGKSVGSSSRGDRVKKHILQQFVDLQQENKDLQRRILQLKDEIYRLERDTGMVADTVHCGKKGKKTLATVRIEGFPQKEYQSKKQSLKRYLRKLELANDQLIDLLSMVEEYIEAIDDSRIRRIMRHRYVDDMTWTQVARQMGNNSTAESCRKEHDRFLKRDRALEEMKLG